MKTVAAGFNAGNVMIKAIAGNIKGGGGGKPTMAQAGGKDAAGIDAALDRRASFLQNSLKKAPFAGLFRRLVTPARLRPRPPKPHAATARYRSLRSLRARLASFNFLNKGQT